ncbi:hypothetical protein STAQ_27870 [Allostella sp. ATCC 35155]|nr:hypothetical protein STAQ_27870 [Stella sp. ATCC 35155]
MIDPMEARQLLADELRRWLRAGRPMPSNRALSDLLGISEEQTRSALSDLECCGDVRIRRSGHGNGRRCLVTHVAERLSWTPRRKFVVAPEPVGDEAPLRDSGGWPAGARFDDDAAAAADQLVFCRLPSVGGAQSLTGSTAAWVAEG